MPLLKNYLNGDLSPRDRAVLTDIINQGIKTDASLLLDPNAVVAKTNGRISRMVIESLLDRIILPAMLSTTPPPVRASEMLQDRSSRHAPRYMSSGWSRVNQLLGGKGWCSGEVSEICGVSGTGKTMICLNTTIALLVQDESLRAIWIETGDHEFSAQRASETAKTFILKQNVLQGPHESIVEELAIEMRVKNVLSRIQVYSCHDVYDVLSAIGVFRSTQLRVGLSGFHRVSPRVFVIDSLSAVLSSLLRMGDGVGHATMMHLSRELRQVASDFDLVVLVTTLPVHLSYPEEKAPSILMTSSVKPGLGSSWRQATDLQLFLSRMELIGGSGNGNNSHGGGHSRLLSESEVDVDMSVEVSAEDVVDITAETRIAEVIKSKRLVSPRNGVN
ncbi:MAG: P-loop containing nucleoside triphosphate hydrolase protein [Linnemannia gamsii]|nr:MAG: P-loop containing nucleoside triphosphate hydrolase protein [Linnemannia gamsii]